MDVKQTQDAEFTQDNDRKVPLPNQKVKQKLSCEMSYDDISAAGLNRGSQYDEALGPSGFCEGDQDTNSHTQHSHMYRRDGIEQKEIKKSCISKLKKPVVKNNSRARGSSLKQKLAESLISDTDIVTAGIHEHPNDDGGSMLKGNKSLRSKQPVAAVLHNKLSEHKTYTCDVCQLIFIDVDYLKTHRATHVEEPGECDVSSFVYSANDSLSSASVGEKLYKCDMCDLDATTCSHREKPDQCDDDLSEMTVPKAKRKPYKCDVCGIAFVANCYLIRHNRIHTGEKPYKCDVCGRDFRESAQMKRHKRTHTGEKPFRCDICGAGFIASYYLTRHRRKHTGEKPYKCDICALDFNSNDCLKRHRRIHTGEKPYKCDFCGLFFRERGQMKTHKRIHTGEKPFKCEVCGLHFTQSGHLIRHKRTHTGDKPYKCDMCDQVFIQSDCLKRHKRVHAGEKPYSCDICGLDFTERVSLKRHKKTHAVEKSLSSDD